MSRSSADQPLPPTGVERVVTLIWPLTPVASAAGMEGGRGLPVTVNSWEPDEAVPLPAALEGVTVTDTE